MSARIGIARAGAAIWLGAAVTLGSLGVMPWSPAEAKTRFVFANESDYDTVDPHAAFDVGRIAVRLNLYDGLYRWEDNPPKLEPWLADSYSVSEDGKTYTFKLKHGVKCANDRKRDQDTEHCHRLDARVGCGRARIVENRSQASNRQNNQSREEQQDRRNAALRCDTEEVTVRPRRHVPGRISRRGSIGRVSWIDDFPIRGSDAEQLVIRNYRERVTILLDTAVPAAGIEFDYSA